MTTPLLDMRAISRRYGEVLANRAVDLRVDRGSVVGLLGENGSGKSTLMKILFGMVRADSGSILFKGRELVAGSPREALAAGIGMIHQHFTLVEAMTVAENVMLGWDRAGTWLQRDAVAAQVREASRAYGLDVDPDAVVAGLPLGMRQRVEIVKALVRGAELLILDEPSSILSPPEVAGLIAVIRRLRADGRSVIFISHKLGEVLEVCDEIVVLRDGAVAGRVNAAAATRDSLAQLMVGRELGVPPERAARTAGAPRVVVEGLAVADASGVKRLKDASFTLHAGEILAIAGVDGNGQAELADALAGMVKPLAGRIVVDGRDVTASGVTRRLDAGIAYIPADRAHTSLVQAMSVADNLALRDFQRAPLARRGRLDTALMARQAVDRIRAFAVRTPSPDLPVRGLSGGNQQKVVLAREIGRAPEVLIAFQPTWGLDPGATRFVIEQVLAVRDRGGAVLYLSAELEEVLALGDRIGVISDGRIPEIVARADVDIGRIGLLMGGGGAELAHAA